MICPRCKKETIIINKNDVTIDSCISCKGIFLDKGELNKISDEIIGDLEYCSMDRKNKAYIFNLS